MSLSAGPRARTQVEEMVAELRQALLTVAGQGVRGEVENIALGNRVWRLLHRPVSVVLTGVGPNVVREVGVDMLDGFIGCTRDVDLLWGAWDVELPGHVDNSVQDRVAMQVGGKESVVVKEDGSIVGNNLI